MFFLLQSAGLIEDFLEIAKGNTDKDLETCGVLGAFLVRLILCYPICKLISAV